MPVISLMKDIRTAGFVLTAVVCHAGVEVGQDQQFVVSTKGAGGLGKLDVCITCPSKTTLPCELEAQPGKAASLVKYVPKEEGVYTVDVSYDGHPVPGSPFPVEAQLPPDPSKVDEETKTSLAPNPLIGMNFRIRRVTF